MSISWYRSIKTILQDESELWLAYLHGQQLDNIPHLTETESCYPRLLFQLPKFLYSLGRTWRLFTACQAIGDVGYFVFAGTSNQMDSLDSTFVTLRERCASVIAIANKNLLN